MVIINPRRVYGNWSEGYTLDLHTISSVFLGYDEFGHEFFDTKRSDLGELLYQLKYKQDKTVLADIIKISANFLINKWKITSFLDGIISMPPSRTHRKIQPVIEISRGLSLALKIPLFEEILRKRQEQPELKRVFDYHDRLEILKDNFVITDRFGLIKDKQILLFDDLFRSGATFNAATEAIYEKGKTHKVYVIALTRTRRLS
jgi:predicted amidophosphoribosyltransferase